MVSLPKPRFTPREYLEREREAKYKSEYLCGHILAMAQHRLGQKEQAQTTLARLRGSGTSILRRRSLA